MWHPPTVRWISCLYHYSLVYARFQIFADNGSPCTLENYLVRAHDQFWFKQVRSELHWYFTSCSDFTDLVNFISVFISLAHYSISCSLHFLPIALLGNEWDQNALVNEFWFFITTHEFSPLPDMHAVSQFYTESRIACPFYDNLDWKYNQNNAQLFSYQFIDWFRGYDIEPLSKDNVIWVILPSDRNRLLEIKHVTSYFTKSNNISELLV